jgi:hypothetical protein
MMMHSYAYMVVLHNVHTEELAARVRARMESLGLAVKSCDLATGMVFSHPMFHEDLALNPHVVDDGFPEDEIEQDLLKAGLAGGRLTLEDATSGPACAWSVPRPTGAPDIVAFREQACDSARREGRLTWDGLYRCPVLNRAVPLDRTHVDHQAPNTFDRIVTDFIAAENPDLDAALVETVDGQEGHGLAARLLEVADHVVLDGTSTDFSWVTCVDGEPLQPEAARAELTVGLDPHPLDPNPRLLRRPRVAPERVQHQG